MRTHPVISVIAGIILCIGIIYMVSQDQTISNPNISTPPIVNEQFFISKLDSFFSVLNKSSYLSKASIDRIYEDSLYNFSRIKITDEERVNIFAPIYTDSSIIECALRFKRNNAVEYNNWRSNFKYFYSPLWEKDIRADDDIDRDELTLQINFIQHLTVQSYKNTLNTSPDTYVSDALIHKYKTTTPKEFKNIIHYNVGMCNSNYCADFELYFQNPNPDPKDLPIDTLKNIFWNKTQQFIHTPL